MLRFVVVFVVTLGSCMFSLKLSARSLVPIVVESTSQGERSWDIFSRLLKDRVIVLGGVINDVMADSIVAQLLFLDNDSSEDISIFINSPGGSIGAGMAIYDTMNFIKADVCTFGIGTCASMAAWLLASGTKGKRRSLPNTSIMIHQPLSEAKGQASDVVIRAEELLRTKERMIDILAEHTGKDREQIEQDIDRDHYMTAEDALEYGIIDGIIVSRTSKEN